MTVDPPRLFVYGTLQPGRLRWPFLAPFARRHRPAGVPGALFDSGHGWPVATFARSGVAPGDEEGDGTVPGTLVDLDPARVDEALAVLDEVEATATDLLTRIAVVTTDGASAWAYHCTGARPGMVRIARWTSVDER